MPAGVTTRRDELVRPTESAMQAWTSMLVAHRRITDTLDRELRDRSGLSLDEYDVLVQLRSAARPLRMSELAERVLISRPSTTRLVDRLVERGWVGRSTVSDDRRVVEVALTAVGRTAQQRAAKVHLDGIARRFEQPLANHDMALLAASLGAVADAQKSH